MTFDIQTQKGRHSRRVVYYVELSPVGGFPLDSLAESGFPLLICIRVESMTSPIVLTKRKNAFLHTN